MTDAALTLHLTGPFAATDASDTPLTGLGRRGQLLLAYLALAPDRRASRAALAALVWGEREEAQARASLRQALSVLRRTLPEGVLNSDRDFVWLDQVAIAEGTGEILEGFDLPVAEDWLREIRLHRKGVDLRVAMEAATLALRQGDGVQATDAAQRVLAIDPSSEPGIQALLQAAALTGDAGSAQVAYGIFCETIKTTLDSDPLPETQALADALHSAPVTPHSDPSTGATLAVLSFDALGAGPEDMLAEGIVEEITGTLSRIHAFHVIARQSAFSLRGQGLDVPQAAARLGADYIVEGTVQRAGERVRISVQLIHGADGRAIWADRFDDRIDDLFDLQDRIAEQVAAAVVPSLRSAEILRARARPATDRSTYELVLTAYPLLWAHKNAENAEAIAILKTALARDPDYGLAQALKAWCHGSRCSYMWSEDIASDKTAAREDALASIARDQDDAPTLVAAASALSLVTTDLSLPRDLVNRALWLDPNNAWGWTRAGWIAAFSHEPEAALEHFARAERLSPLDPFRFNVLFGKAAALRQLDRFDASIDLIEEGIRINPSATWAYRMLVGGHMLAGNPEAARQAAALLAKAFPGLTVRKLMDYLPPSWDVLEPRYLRAMLEAGICLD